MYSGGSGVGVNPKINNLHPGYEGAKYELVMISDSSVRCKESIFGEKNCKLTFAVKHSQRRYTIGHGTTYDE